MAVSQRREKTLRAAGRDETPQTSAEVDSRLSTRNYVSQRSMDAPDGGCGARSTPISQPREKNFHNSDRIASFSDKRKLGGFISGTL